MHLRCVDTYEVCADAFGVRMDAFEVCMNTQAQFFRQGSDRPQLSTGWTATKKLL